MSQAPSFSHNASERIVLGIETSCDETAAALLKGGRQILSSVVASQIETHRAYGGVVPELAFRKHMEAINEVLADALGRAGLGWNDLDGVAVSHGPGLVGALLVGVAAAKVVAGLMSIPLLGVNHLESHLYANFLQHPMAADEPLPTPPAKGTLRFPLVCLIVSGGHTILLHMTAHGYYRSLGETRDDAAGEAFDKVARHLGLGYPGGPVVDRMAREGNPDAVAFPRAWLGEDSLEFSFSGLKTAVLNFSRGPKAAGVPLEDVCASFQEAIVDVLVGKTMRAVERTRVGCVIMAGGVACNARLRVKMEEACARRGIDLFYPSPALCTDNALMVACAGHFRLAAGLRSDLELDCFPVLPLATGP